MDEDFGFMERRSNGGLRGDSKNEEEGKSTNGGVSDQLDQSLRTLSVSLSDDSTTRVLPPPSAKTTTSRVEENNNQLENGDKMLKHTKKSSTTTTSGQSITTPPPNDSTPSLQKPSQNTPKISSSPPSSQPTDNQVTLPQRFVVKYLGYRETSNLWGIKYTRRPVDEMVKEAKEMLSQNATGTGGKSLPLLKLEVTEGGISVEAMPQNNNPEFPSGKFVIEAISYGVQDLVYTRVFAMIVVKSALTKDGQAIKLADIQKATNNNGGSTTPAVNGDGLPFRCHAFVCDSRQTARKLTYSLASAFHKFSQSVAAGKISVQKPKKFAIDLRSCEEIEADLIDSEA